MHPYLPQASFARRAILGAALATALVPAAAQAAAGPQGIRAGHNITVFHNIDMVAVFGHGDGEQTQVDVFRGAHRIATARGPAVPTDDGGAVEVNHGVEGAAGPGDCFEGATPDIRPGDRIVVSNPGGAAGVDEAVVDEITIDSRTTVRTNPATGNPVVAGTLTEHVDDDDDPGTPSSNDDGDPLTDDTPVTTNVERDSVTDAVVADPREEVWVQGNAFYVDAAGARTPIPANLLDSAGYLDLPDDNQLRVSPNEVVAGATAGTYVTKYYDADPDTEGEGFNLERNRNNRDDEDVFDAIAAGADGHAGGYGHVAPLPPVSMLVDGLEEQLTPAVGCEAAPKLASSAGTTSVDTLNIANTGPAATDPVLTVGGFAAAGTAAADVVLSDGTAEVVKAATLGGGTGQQGWTAEFTKADLTGLAEGTLTARLRIGGTLVGASKEVLYDVTAPAFTPSLAEGTHVGEQQLTISGATDPVTYQLDGGPVLPYAFLPITLRSGSHTVVLRSTDAAGNTTERTLNYVIDAPTPTGSGDGSGSGSGSDSGSGSGSGGGGQAAAAGSSTAAPSTQSGASRSLLRPAAVMLVNARRLKGTKARRSGLTARFSAAEGSRSAVIRVYRSTGGRLTLLRTRTASVRPGANSVALRSKALRRKLRAGLYLVEVTLTGTDGSTGTPATSFVRVLR